MARVLAWGVRETEGRVQRRRTGKAAGQQAEPPGRVVEAARVPEEQAGHVRPCCRRLPTGRIPHLHGRRA